MKRILIAVAYAIAGLVVAVGLTAGAYAIGGRDLSKPARPFELTDTNREVETDPVEPKEAKSPEDKASPDDKGGDEPDDKSESNSGSSNSGSGSSDSGSGSSNSGSGSDDEPDDD